MTLTRRYDYIHDLFLVDVDGNILFSTARQPDLGTNLFNGIYANSQFAKKSQFSLDTGRTLFSDLEHYAPSSNQVAGFLITPMLDEHGNKIGIFALQLRLDRINEHMHNSIINSSMFTAQ